MGYRLNQPPRRSDWVIQTLNYSSYLIPLFLIIHHQKQLSQPRRRVRLLMAVILVVLLFRLITLTAAATSAGTHLQLLLSAKNTKARSYTWFFLWQPAVIRMLCLIIIH